MVSREQLRAARAWLDLSQDDVAKLATVASKTIKNFERGKSVPYERTLRDIQKALEDKGIEFLFDGPVGVGIRVRKRSAGSFGLIT
jgi:DNA-binding XRE family transcriptional regulator